MSDHNDRMVYTDTVHQAASVGLQRTFLLPYIIITYTPTQTHNPVCISFNTGSDTVSTFNKLFIKDPAFFIKGLATKETKGKRPFILRNCFFKDNCDNTHSYSASESFSAASLASSCLRISLSASCSCNSSCRASSLIRASWAEILLFISPSISNSLSCSGSLFLILILQYYPHFVIFNLE